MPHISHQHPAGPVWRCDFCGYERVANQAAVEAHERGHARVEARESLILGPDGQPVTVVTASVQQ